MGKWTKVANVTELQPDQGTVVEAGGKALALFSADGTVYAIDNTCRHRGGPLGEGELQGSTVTRPWHGWQYDVTTGAAVANPLVRVACYPAKVEAGAVLVEL